MLAELKPCPFCGRTPVIEDCGNSYFVRCKCGIAQDKLYTQRCYAISRWNTRKGEWKTDDTPLLVYPPEQLVIIMCKDCKWKQGSECVRFADVRPFPDDYCSRAERREV